MHQVLACGIIEDGHTGKQHPKENGHIDSEKHLGDHHRGGLPPQPGRRLNALDSVVGFAALRRFVLLAPRANLFAKRK